ncbi:MULE transposase domain [Sesbania bispinosa]|nr:MULE transposase domain [Sesbania bispinosa]
MDKADLNNSDSGKLKNSKSSDKDNGRSQNLPEGYKRINELAVDDIKGLEFDSEEDAYDFYSKYAKFNGFAVRKDDVYRDSNNLIRMRQMVCNRQGERSEKHLNRTDRIREAKAIRRTKCHAMFNKIPKIVVTDEDGAMREAIRTIFPGALQRLCSWHLHQNACENVKNLKFLEDFKSLVYGNFSIAKFEDEWKKVIDNHGLNNNKWVSKVYDLRRMWATAYLRDTFFGGIRTISICEGINSFIKRHNELMSDFKSLYTNPVLTTALQKYEVDAAKIFTRNKFFDVRKQIEKIATLNMIDRSEVGTEVRLKINMFGSPDCVYLCCVIRLMHEQVESLPSNLVCKGWTKYAKVQNIFDVYGEEDDSSKKDLLRSGAISAACNRHRNVVDNRPYHFVRNIERIHNLADEVEREDGGEIKNGDISRLFVIQP